MNLQHFSSPGAAEDPQGRAASGGHDARALYDLMEECVAVFALDGTHLYVNAAAEALTGKPARELLGRTYHRLFPDVVGNEFDAAFQRLAAGQTQREQVQVYYPPWDRHTENRLYRTGDEIVALCRDVTALRHAEAAAEAESARADESERQFQGMIENLPQPAWWARPDGSIEYYNPRWYEYTGTTLGQMRGWGWQAVHDPLILPEVLTRWRRSLETGEVFEMEFPLQRADGAFRWFLTRATPVRDRRGRVVRWIGLNTDIDEQRRTARRLHDALEEQARLHQELAAQKRLLDAVIHQMPSGLALAAAPGGRMTYANPQAEQIWGFPLPVAASVAEYTPWRAFDAGGRPVPLEDLPLARALRGETVRDQRLWFARADGTLRASRSNSAPIRDEAGRIVAAVTVFDDMTREAEAEQEQKAASADREALLGQLQRTLRFSEVFVGILGHDLRSPLTAILMNGHRLARRPDETVAGPGRQIAASAGRMSRMIEQILDFTRARIGEGIPVHHRDADLLAICRDAAEELRPAHPGTPIHVEAVGDTRGRWDPDRLAQVFSNLLGNACRHGREGGGVDCLIDGRAEGAVTVRVHNQGAVPPALLPVIFEPFRGQRKAGPGGLGLGLFITEQIVAAHGGQVSVESSEETGTTFLVRLPRHR